MVFPPVIFDNYYDNNQYEVNNFEFDVLCEFKIFGFD